MQREPRGITPDNKDRFQKFAEKLKRQDEGAKWHEKLWNCQVGAGNLHGLRAGHHRIPKKLPGKEGNTSGEYAADCITDGIKIQAVPVFNYSVDEGHTNMAFFL